MSTDKVFVGCKIMPEAEKALSEFCTFEQWRGPGRPSESDLIAKTADKNGLLLDGGQKVTRRILENAPLLRAVSNSSVGYNNFDLAAMKDFRIIGTNVAGTLDDSVADLTIALMLDVSRRISELDRLVKSGQWQVTDDFSNFGTEMHHKTLGIIGLGRIGEALVQRATFGFGMPVLYFNRRRKPDAEARLGVTYASLEELLARSDYVVLLTPYTPESHHMIGAEQFRLMKRSAFFINVSRGKNVDEPALAEALKNGIIAGAGLDVFEREPVLPDNPLLSLANAVTVPHIGSSTPETRLKMDLQAVENLRIALSGVFPDLTVPELR